MNFKSILISRSIAIITLLCVAIAFNSTVYGMEDIYPKIIADQEVIETAKGKLFNAIVHNDIDEVKRLIAEGIADIDAQDRNGETALGLSVRKNNVQLALALIDAGADLNIANDHGTAFFYAVKNENIKLVKALIKAGADVNARDTNQCTPLVLACAANRIFLAEVLINASADVNAVDKDGNTALLYAVKSVNIKLIKALIKAGADINACNKYGVSALISAVHSCYYRSAETRMAIINPTPKSLTKKNIETLLMIYRNTYSCLSELPQEVLKIIITCAYPEYAVDHQTIACLHPQVLVDVMPLETLSALIKNGVLQQESIFKAWQEKLTGIVQELKRSKQLSDERIQSFETDVLKTMEASLK